MSRKKMTKALEMTITDAAEKARLAKEPDANLLNSLARLASSVKDLYTIEEPKKSTCYYEELMASIEEEIRQKKK